MCGFQVTILFVVIIDLPNDEWIKYPMEYLFHKKEVKIDNNVPLYLRRYQEIPFHSYALSFLKAEMFGIQKGSPLSRCKTMISSFWSMCSIASWFPVNYCMQK